MHLAYISYNNGHVRFIDSKTILVNELKNEFKYWRKGFLKMIKQANLDYKEINWFEHKDINHPLSAIGVYVNYLEIGNLMLFPTFEIRKDGDKEAIKTIRAIFPERHIELINIMTGKMRFWGKR